MHANQQQNFWDFSSSTADRDDTNITVWKFVTICTALYLIVSFPEIASRACMTSRQNTCYLPEHYTALPTVPTPYRRPYVKLTVHVAYPQSMWLDLASHCKHASWYTHMLSWNKEGKSKTEISQAAAGKLLCHKCCEHWLSCSHNVFVCPIVDGCLLCNFTACQKGDLRLLDNLLIWHVIIAAPGSTIMTCPNMSIW